MATIKLTTWNIEHFGRMLPDPPLDKRVKLDAIAAEIEAINPDILCIVEAPGNLPALRDWIQSNSGLADRYRVATIPGTQDILDQNPANPRKALQRRYGMQGTDITGNQWVWFLIRGDLFRHSRARLLAPAAWQGINKQKKWTVHEWGNFDGRKHSHWRHPQTLIIELAGVEVEIIGVHLKSKINTKKAFDNGDLMPAYVKEALKARIKLATEAYDIRRYIDNRFKQAPSPRIIVCGDMNDGPGRGHFEREYLFFDLVSNVQGDMFFARRYLYHALFDFEEQLRWSTRFHDRIEKWSRSQPGNEALPPAPIDPAHFQLIDHILFTQAFTGENACPRIEPFAGRVEHTIHERIAAPLTRSDRPSDHVPVSVNITI